MLDDPSPLGPEATVEKKTKGRRRVPRRSLTIEQVLTLLAETPQRLACLTSAQGRDQLHTSPARGEWSANDVLAHLRACADVWGTCMVTIIVEDKPTLRAINPLTWIKKTDYLELEFLPALRAFTAQRSELLALLEPLPRDTWSREATVTGAGKALERTVLFYEQWLARHERQHVKQVESIVNRMRG